MPWVNLTDVVIVLMSAAIAVTVVGNLLVIVSILTQERTRRVLSNRYLVSLAIADLGVGLFVMLPSVVKVYMGEWAWGAGLCKLWVTADVGFCSASIYSLVGISLDRFYAVYSPVRYAVQTSGLLTNMLIVVAWLMAVVISFPMHISWKRFSTWTRAVEKHESTCSTPTEPTSMGFVIYSGTLAFIIPTVLLTTLYIAIGYQMRIRQQGKIKVAKKGLKQATKVDVFQNEYMGSSVNLVRTELKLDGATQNADSGFTENIQTTSVSLTPVPGHMHVHHQLTAVQSTVHNHITAVQLQNGGHNQLAQPQNGGHNQLTPMKSQNGGHNQPGGVHHHHQLTPRQSLTPVNQLSPVQQRKSSNRLNISRRSEISQEVDSQASWKETEFHEGNDPTDLHDGLDGLQEEEIRQLMILQHTGKRKSKNLTKAERRLRSEEKKQTRITLMMSVIIGSFALCWTPFAVMFFASPFSQSLSAYLEDHPIVGDVITWIGYVNSGINPIIYASMNAEIRSGMSRWLCPKMAS